jgi:hypothetical protein
MARLHGACRSTSTNSASTSPSSTPQPANRRRPALRARQKSSSSSPAPNAGRALINDSTAAGKNSGHPLPARRHPKPQGPRGRGQLRSHHPLRRPRALPGHQGARLRHPLRTVRERVQDPLPRRWRALRNGPAAVHLALPIISRIKVMANMNIAERRIPQDGRIMKTGRRPPWTCASPPCPPSTANPWCSGCSTARRSTSTSKTSACPPTSTTTSPRPSRSPTASSSSPARPAPAKPPRSTPPSAASTPSTPSSSPPRTRSNTTSTASSRSRQRGHRPHLPAVLRAFLRQDPDRIMVGEMRDVETAQIAIQASLTGHLVLSTLHTNDAPGAVTRLVDMGCEPFLVSASLEGVLAQRLVRTICKDCRPLRAQRGILTQLGLSPTNSATNISTPARLPTCGHHRLPRPKGLYELLTSPIPSATDHRPRPHRGPQTKSHRTRHGHPPRGRPAQHLRRHHHHRGSPQIHLIQRR